MPKTPRKTPTNKPAIKVPPTLKAMENMVVKTTDFAAHFKQVSGTLALPELAPTLATLLTPAAVRRALVKCR